MRLARRALVAALVTLMLCAAVSAQTLRPETDPRNLSPTVGTGGPEGGPTGLFTIYDGQTIRRGEYTFSIAYSNFDRDPGNVDITDVPLSFNVGLGDHLELFFKTTGYRGVKVNNPQNLSSFYLPNSQLKFPFLGTGPAIVLAPNATGVNIAGLAVFRPAFNQPFVQFPFTGGSAGTFRQGPGNAQNGNFGCVGCTFTLGAPVIQGNSGNFGPADNFPGIGSPVGGILPGIVLATTTLPATALTLPITVPATFTVAPSYLPDAPFINRLYGQSSFSNFVFGAKWQLTSTKNPLSFAIMPMYRWYPDKANDFSGFNQMQRGAGPGGDIGDFGLVLALDGRLSRSVSISVNGGYWLNSNPKGTFGGTEAVLLDRPDEFIAGIGFDFPVNKYFQPILELRSTQYVGGRTPNAFENSPVDALAGVKIYPHRWLGIGLAYRMHINQQDRSLFNGADFNTPVQQITNVNPIGPAPLTVIPATTVPATVGAFPRGFIESDDANGFIAQFWIGHRNARTPPPQPPHELTVNVSASSPSVERPCPADSKRCDDQPNPSQKVTLTADAKDTLNDPLVYEWKVTGGLIEGTGANVTWNLEGLAEGTYTATVEVDDGCGCIVYCETTVTVKPPSCCKTPPVCPTVNINVPDSCVTSGTQVDVTAYISDLPADERVTTYKWTLSAGRIVGDENSASVKVDTSRLEDGTEVTASLTVTVEKGGATLDCPVSPKTFRICIGCTKFDSYFDLTFNDEKARLDNFAIFLNAEKDSQGYYVIFGSCEGEADQRSQRAVDYLADSVDRRRITVINGGCRELLTVELWRCPLGVDKPTPTATATVSPCPAVCKTKPKAGNSYRRPHAKRYKRRAPRQRKTE